MKVSLNWIKQFIDFDLPPVDELVERIGAQLGAVEEVENLGQKYEGILAAKVVSCVEYADSDHLHVCMIDDGGKAKEVERDANGHVQVVCGAPNVRESVTVAWIPPGVTVPESVDKDPFVLEKREIRGQVSNGMLASLRELALGDSHDGILEIDKDVAPGTPFADVYKLDDYVIDIENKMFTHRPDCFGALGVAREIAGILGHKFASPDWYQLNPSLATKEADLGLQVTNEIPELVPRFTAITLADVKVGPSPLWLQVALAKVGQKSINNVVDLTNFYMLVTGQPLHAYDYDKIASGKLGARFAKDGETLALLNGKTIAVTGEDMVITNGNKPVGLAGVMGGSETEVSNDTTNIILECANFDMYTIRRTSMRQGLFTDAVTRFNKGQSPLQNLAVLAKVVTDLQHLTGGNVACEVVDDNRLAERQWVHPPVPVSAEFINARLGFNLSANEMKQLLENVECQVSVDGENLTVTAPFWRTDIETREDVVEEVGRLYGYDHLPLVLPERSIKPVAKDPLLELKSQVRELLAKAGANEVLTYSFVHGDLLTKVGQNPADAFQVGNALSPDLQYYRLSLTPSLLEKVHPNIKAGYDEFALFEIGKGHNLAHATDEEGLPAEFEMLDVVYARSDKVKKPGAAFYEARKFLVNLATAFGVQLEFRPIENEEDYPVAKPYDHNRSAQVWAKGTNMPLGMVGEYKTSVRRALKLPAHTAGFGIGLQQLQEAAKQSSSLQYVPLPRFPKVTQDITLKVPADLRYQTLFDFVWDELTKVQPEQTFPVLGPRDIYQSADDAAHKQITFRLEIASYKKTMTDAEVNKLLDEVAAAAKDKFGAERI